jgi:hypothetical protein
MTPAFHAGDRGFDSRWGYCASPMNAPKGWAVLGSRLALGRTGASSAWNPAALPLARPGRLVARDRQLYARRRHQLGPRVTRTRGVTARKHQDAVGRRGCPIPPPPKRRGGRDVNAPFIPPGCPAEDCPRRDPDACVEPVTRRLRTLKAGDGQSRKAYAAFSVQAGLPSLSRFDQPRRLVGHSRFPRVGDASCGGRMRRTESPGRTDSGTGTTSALRRKVDRAAPCRAAPLRLWPSTPRPR